MDFVHDDEGDDDDDEVAEVDDAEVVAVVVGYKARDVVVNWNGPKVLNHYIVNPTKIPKFPEDGKVAVAVADVVGIVVVVVNVFADVVGIVIVDGYGNGNDNYW